MAGNDPSSVIAAVCRALADGAIDRAAAIVQGDYPFNPEPITRRRFRQVDYTRVFVRDGFVDRYSGARLVFPPVLRVLSFALPCQFPYHPNWKADKTHPAYWQMSATIDHVIPVTRGGLDEPSNWVTTSMVRNSAKMNWTLEELGWQLHPPGAIETWDGMLRWFLDYTDKYPRAVLDNSMRQWRRAAEIVTSAMAYSREGVAGH
jgi:hypothetical protein